MSTLEEAMSQIEEELVKNKAKLQTELNILLKQIQKSRTTRNLMLRLINADIKNLAAKIIDHMERIEAHKEIIEKFENGTIYESESD